jgi:nicotinate-nucleotide pyrophosphorylase
MSATELDRSTIVEALFGDLRDLRVDPDDGEVGLARIVADGGGPCAGIVVVKEIFARVGVRTRPLVPDGAVVGPATAIAEVGGPLAAIRGAAPLALRWLRRLSAVASGAAPPEAGHPLDAYATRLSAPGVVGHDGPSFHLELEG